MKIVIVFIMHTYFHILICVVLSGVIAHINLENKLVKLQRRAAKVILDWDFTTPSSLIFAELKWMTFPNELFIRKSFKCFKHYVEMPLIT